MAFSLPMTLARPRSGEVGCVYQRVCLCVCVCVSVYTSGLFPVHVGRRRSTGRQDSYNARSMFTPLASITPKPRSKKA